MCRFAFSVRFLDSFPKSYQSFIQKICKKNQNEMKNKKDISVSLLFLSLIVDLFHNVNITTF